MEVRSNKIKIEWKLTGVCWSRRHRRFADSFLVIHGRRTFIRVHARTRVRSVYAARAASHV